jgi:hydrogenase-4 component F
MNLILWIPLLCPFVLAGLGLLPRTRVLRRYSGVASSVLILGSGIGIVVIDSHERGALSSAAGVLRADSLSAYMLAVIGAVALIATWGGAGTGRSLANAHRAYAALVCVFLGAMSLAVLADNLGVMWVAIEATTIATAFLVSHHRTRRSLEAAWKYVILGSVGVAIAFLGIVLIYASSANSDTPTLSWVALNHVHLNLDPGLIRLGGALAVLGFATKAGLAPMHSWLPDAHSQAPAPVSGLMSGVLLSVALYAIMRIQSLVDLSIGAEFLRTLLIGLGLLSLAIAAALLLRQRDYKRMLAYSSIEHMGIMAIGVAIGPTALPAVLLYILSHGLIKAGLFVLSGRILAAEKTPMIAEVRALLFRRPGLAVPWLIGIAALLGFPPSGIFFAEVGIILAGWSQGLGIVMGVSLVLMLLIFAGLTRLTVAMLFGPAASSGQPESVSSDKSPRGRLAPIILALGMSAIIPFLAGPVGSTLARAVIALGHPQ